MHLTLALCNRFPGNLKQEGMPEPGADTCEEGSCSAGKHMTVEAMVAQQTRIERCALGSHLPAAMPQALLKTA